MQADKKVQTTYGSTAWLRFSRAITAKATEKAYRNSLKVFMRFMKVSGEVEAAKLLEGTNEQIEDHIVGFIAAQKEENLSSSIIHTRLAAIKLFYDMNRRPLAPRR